ncbi:MAG: glycosyltransferase family 2 protein [Gaiellaceae bacterium]
MANSDVTVVLPAHGPGRFFAEAVASALADAPAEVLVVEDGTTGVDESSLGGARLLRLSHVRRSRARNAGVEAATTPYVAFLDEDDLSLPGRLERQRSALEAEPRATFTYGWVNFIDATGAPHVNWTDEEGRPVGDWTQILAARFDALVARGSTYEAIAELGGPLYTSATMVRRDSFLAAGGYDPAFDAHEDIDLYLRLARLGPVVPTLGGPVSTYRVHGQNTRSDDLYRGIVGVTEKHLPFANGGARRALLERRVDALWGLGAFDDARRAAFSAAVRDPRLLSSPRFAKRLLGLTLPTRMLESRR